MKKSNIFILIITFIASGLTAQLDRSKLPEPGPAPEINLGKAEKFTLENGLKVFVITNKKLPRIAYTLIIDRDPLMEGDKSGMLGMVGEMLTAGTTNRSKDDLNEEIDFLGARLNASSTSISATALSKHKDKMMELMSDVLYNPLLPEEELDKLKTQAKSGLAMQKSSPNAISSVLTKKLLFGNNHPYGESETEETIDNISTDDIRAYYNIFFKPNIAYLAIVGDINLKEAKEMANKYFGKWQPGNVPIMKFETPKSPEKNTVALVDRASAKQSVLDLTYPVEMHLTNSDYLATRVINFVLGGGASARLFMNLREDKGYTYGAYASIGSDQLVTSFSAGSSVGGHVTDSAITEIIYEIRNMAENGITEEELKAAKANLSGSFGRSLENPATIANFALNMERYDLPRDYYATYLQRLNALTVQDVNQAAKKYLKPDHLHITVVGNASEIKDKLEKFGPVKMYDVSGNPEKELTQVADDITPDVILNNYFKAIGGAEKLKSIKTAKIEYSTELQGMSIGMTFVHDLDNERFSQITSMMGNVAQKMVFNKGTAKVSGGGQEQEIPAEQAEALRSSLYIFPELNFGDPDYDVRVDGVKEIDGNSAYKVIVTDPAGNISNNYFSVDSGLKVLTESQEQGEVKYENYAEKDGVLYPQTLIIANPMIPAPLNMKLEMLEFNLALTDSDF